MLKLADFDYNLPKELIAQYPLKQRDSARLMVLDRKRNTIEEAIFKDLPGYLKPKDLLILNDTKVLRCRLVGTRAAGAKVEILLLKRREGLSFKALIKPGRVKLNEIINFNGGGLSGVISAKDEITFILPRETLSLNLPDAAAVIPQSVVEKDTESIYHFGSMPLPPYIKREAEELDNDYYQTVYAKNEGAVASPTAGLHFTHDLIKKMASLSVNISYVTLHVGAATFKPVRSQDITKHSMEEEYFRISQDAKQAIEKARADKARIIAAGTTSLRTIETYAFLGKEEGSTDLFIYPGFKFKLADCLLTNFHLPRTTLFMLVCAFAGRELIMDAYRQAIEKKYRFYSYGDAMLII